MENLRRLRERSGKTQQEIADLLQIQRPTYTRYESGEREPDYSTLAKLANIFDVTTDYLLGISDNPHPANPFEGVTKEEVDALIEKTKNSDTVVVSVMNYGGNNSAFEMSRKDFEEWLKVKDQIPAEEMDELIALKKKIDKQVRDFKK